MCGITGVFSSDSREVTPELLLRMANVLKHRGPDGEGYALIDTSEQHTELRIGDDSPDDLDPELKHIAAPLEHPVDLGLGHRRLSIIDLSTAGHQPMSNEDKTIWIIHNGEIYNHIELREELRSRGHRFQSNTDTEVILHSYEEWGISCLHRFNGMWAFAIWDSRDRKLVCCRDRFGIKPFYYYFDGRRFLFASEIKAILEADFIRREPHDQAVFDYLAYRAEDCNEGTFFRGINRLKSGHYLEFFTDRNKLEIRLFYDIPLDHRLSQLTDYEYNRAFRELLEDSIRLRLISDVPVGSCLSGGLDSSAIVCLIDKRLREDSLKLPRTEGIQKTFSVRFNEHGYDEGDYINHVVQNTAVDAYFTYATDEQLWNDISALIWYQDEPFATTRTYAQWELYKLVKQHGIRVSLDGQGGDEILAGYDEYYPALLCFLTRSLRLKELAREFYSHYRLQGGNKACRNLVTAAYHLSPRWLERWERKITHRDGGSCLHSKFTDGLIEHPFRDGYSSAAGRDFFTSYLYEIFTLNHLPRLLRHQDRNSMAHSVESRVPFLDYRLVEFAFAIPWQQKIRNGARKYILRNAMREIIPESVRNRQDKIGFNTPWDAWIKAHFKDEISDILDSQSFLQRPYFDAAKVKRELDAFRQGRRNIATKIWTWVILDLWLRMYIDR
jgi:asparagine synthase (glutamine-hydrolysing)